MRARPLPLAASGVTSVALDLRVVHLDVLPDVLGWALLALAAHQLGVRRAAVAGAVAAVASAPDVAIAHRYLTYDPFSGTFVEGLEGTGYPQRLVFDLVTSWRAAAMVVALVAGGACLWALLGALAARAVAVDDSTASARLRLARAAALLGWIVPHLVVATVQWAGDGIDPVWGDSLEPVALLGLAAAGVLVVGGVLHRNRAWTATDEDRITPWGQLMTDRLP